MKTMYRQGDVLLVRIEAIPLGAKQCLGPVVLAEGEVTGHAHQIPSGAQLWQLEETRFVLAEHEVEMTHQEHSSIQLLPGVYEVRRQREYDLRANRYVGD